jgi:hypothetical protein
MSAIPPVTDIDHHRIAVRPTTSGLPLGARSTSRAFGFRYLLAGSADNVVAPEQLLAVERLVGTQPEYVRHEVDYLGLLMGKRTLEEYWPRIARWMKEVD